MDFTGFATTSSEGKVPNRVFLLAAFKEHVTEHGCVSVDSALSWLDRLFFTYALETVIDIDNDVIYLRVKLFRDNFERVEHVFLFEQYLGEDPENLGNVNYVPMLKLVNV